MTGSGSPTTTIHHRLRLATVVLGLLGFLAACDPGSTGAGGPSPSSMDPTALGTPATPTTSFPEQPASTTPAAAEPGSATARASGARFAVVGDSITAGFARVEGTTVADRNSWIPFAAQHEGLSFAGGYAVPGATTAVMRDGVGPVDADLLVVMGGTNDLGEHVPWDVTRANLLQIVATAGVPVVLLSAIPPRDDAAAGVRGLNGQLEQLATEQGWQFVDPWSGMSGDGAWVTGTSDDGIHPVEQVVSLVGERLAAAIADAG